MISEILAPNEYFQHHYGGFFFSMWLEIEFRITGSPFLSEWICLFRSHSDKKGLPIIRNSNYQNT